MILPNLNKPSSAAALNAHTMEAQKATYSGITVSRASDEALSETFFATYPLKFTSVIPFPMKSALSPLAEASNFFF